MTQATLYGIKNCDTVKRACAWLQARGIDYAFHDYKKDGVPVDHLRRWAREKGWEVLLNRQGPTWRKQDEATKASVVDAESAIAVMNAHSSVIRRPIVEWGGPGKLVTVGFKEDQFAQAAGSL